MSFPPCRSMPSFPSPSSPCISIVVGPGLLRVGWAATLRRGPRRSQGGLAGPMGSLPLPCRGAESQSPSRYDPLHHAAARGQDGQQSRIVGRVGVGAPGHVGSAPLRGPPRLRPHRGTVTCHPSTRVPPQRHSFWPICPPMRRQRGKRLARNNSMILSNSSKSTRLRPPRTPRRPTPSLWG
jgi:hypothetical protein